MEKVGAHRKLKPYENLVHKKFATYKLMLYFGLSSVAILFLTLTLSYFFSSNFQPSQTETLRLPWIFYLNTVIILVSTYTVILAKRAHKADDADQFKEAVYASAVLGGLFLIGQFFGWLILYQNGLGASNHPSSAYLYVISGLHALHLIGGVFFLTYYINEFSGLLHNEATALVFFTDPVPELKLNLLEVYWHFLTALWIYVLLFFLVIG